MARALRILRLVCVLGTLAGCSSGHELPGTLEETLRDAGLRIDPVGDDIEAAMRDATVGDGDGDGDGDSSGDGDGEGRAGSAGASAGTGAAGINGRAGNGGAGNGRAGMGGGRDGMAGASGDGFGNGCGRCPAISSMLGDVATCCHASGECGVDLSSLGTDQCVQQNAPGQESASCPEFDVMGFFQIPGCCTPAGECGLLIRQLLPLGCTTARIALPFGDVTTPGSTGRCR